MQDLKNISIENVSYASDLRTSLLPVSKKTGRGYEVHFKKDGTQVINKYGKNQVHADRVGDLYFVREHDESACSASTINRISLGLLHKRFGLTIIELLLMQYTRILYRDQK